ncbi:hypothetical protein [uncultured Microbacterium sp.]|jgi:hypothetical protein|uniref:hypothetical protein n=1 Tax=Microbacterium algeriense TaxID=2615184 RepID=UPI002594EBC0|nr:hypothetical protein [uncultured Microbacterium sp.]
MALVKGNVATFGLESISLLGLRLTFVPSGPGVIEPKYLLVSKPVEVTVAVDGSGAFTANLAPTDNVHPERWYTIRAEWPDSATNFTQLDFIDWKLYVPTEGGDFADLIEHPSNPQLAWVGIGAPPTPPASGSLWLDDNPDNVADPLNTGDLYQWE